MQAVSLIGKLIGWTGWPQWALELIAVGAVAGVIWGIQLHTLHVGIAEGVHRQQVDDDKATAKLKERADKDTAAAKARADAAEKAQQNEHQALVDYVAAHPLHGGLCLNNPHGGRGDLQTGGAANGVNATPSSSASDVQPVPAGDSGPGRQRDPDIRGLLDLLAKRGDGVSAELREYQGR
jgi:hypothetical protein